jgi:phosphatidylethanolamine/phosphatidyl-N-methylethanolamine N-methyltransferase
MIAGIDFSKIDSILELGPGTGVFTKLLVKYANPKAKIICIDYEQPYLDLLRSEYGDRVILVQGEATKTPEILASHGIERPDIVLSWLPYSALRDSHGDLVKQLIDYTAQGTIFRWFSYTPSKFLAAYKGLPVERKSFVLLNLPPAYVYWVH